MRAGWYLAVGLAGLAFGGCRAQVDTPDGGADLAGADGGDDLGIDDDGGFDLASSDLACSGPSVPEICNNGCDDDHNGYADADDPACTPQLLVVPGTTTASAPLQRLFLGSTPHLVTLDGNLMADGYFAEYQRAFAPTAFLTRESSMVLRTLTLAPGGGTGTFTDYAPTYRGRDVCVFNGELLVVERGPPGVLHRFKPDGTTELGVVSLGAVLATSCASDGKLLYVAVHDTIGSPSQFLVFDQTLAPVAGSPVAIPGDLLTNGLDRCLDIAFSQTGVFYGLFVASGGVLNDAALPGASQIYPFAFDGGVGAPIDAGLVRAIGEFIP